METGKLTAFIYSMLLCGLILAAGTIAAAPPLSVTPTHQVTPESRVATEEELYLAYTEWVDTQHANSYDDGMGANTTCARCKSPVNWDPASDAQAAALDCFSCKRIPGAPRPDLSGGVIVEESDWMNIGCEICHQPVDGSYLVSISFWDQANQVYAPVQSSNELCAKCHEGTHGFEVMEEQESSPAHHGWECTNCHGSHGSPSACTDCHDPSTATGAAEHARHPNVNCTACHDNGDLSVWRDGDPESRHFREFITRRFAHTLTSWPSHNLSKTIDCLRCHHPANQESAVVVQEISCKACHPDGAVIFWCEYFERDVNPNATPVSTP